MVSITTQKQVPSSPPKTIQKRAHATAESQETVVAAVVSQGGSAVACEWCSWQGVACICTHQSNHTLLEVPCTSLYQLVQGKKDWQKKGSPAHSF